MLTHASCFNTRVRGLTLLLTLNGWLSTLQLSTKKRHKEQRTRSYLLQTTMAKTKSNRRGGGAKQKGNWSNAEHDARTAKRIASLNKKKRRRQQQLEEESAVDCEQPLTDDNTNNIKPQPNKQQKKEDQPNHELPLHQIRLKKKKKIHNRLTSHVPTNIYKRSHLAHDNYDQIDSQKSRLATAQIQRKINKLKDRLENWDPVEEAQLASKKQQQQLLEEEDKNSIEYKMKLDAHNHQLDKKARQKASSEYQLLHAKHGVNSSTHRRKSNLRSKPRPGPETWKLRGAARPAHEVYDFDTRYVDVHIKARDEANAKARRSWNVLCKCRGRFALDEEGEGIDEDEEIAKDDSEGSNNSREKKSSSSSGFSPPQPYCRQYLSLLTQLASLHLHRRNYSSARTALLEAINLEGPTHSHSITNARYQLMNMYLHTNRPSSARKLCSLLHNDNSAWIKYSAALIEYVSWNILHEDGSTAQTAERLLTHAIRGNVYVVYLLGWSSTFEKSMEYTNEVCDGHELESESGSVLEAIEYGCSCYDDNNEEGEDDEDKKIEKGMAIWLGTEGSLDWMRSVVLRVLNDENSNHEGGAENEDRLTRADLLSWESKLNKEEEEFEKDRTEREEQKLALSLKEDGKIDYGHNSEEEEGENDREEEPDVVMYAGMFRTAMDWLQDAGEFLKAPSYDYVDKLPQSDSKDDDIEDHTGDEVGKKNGTNDNNGGSLDEENSSGSGSSDSKKEKTAIDKDVSSSSRGSTDSFDSE